MHCRNGLGGRGLRPRATGTFAWPEDRRHLVCTCGRTLLFRWKTRSKRPRTVIPVLRTGLRCGGAPFEACSFGCLEGQQTRMDTHALEPCEREVLSALRRRGVVCRLGRRDGALIPSSEENRQRWYRLLGHYSFRLFLRDLIRLRHGAMVEELTHYCSLEVARHYLGEVDDLGLIQWRKRKAVLKRTDVRSFGPTLEWYVAEVLRREFGMASIWNLRPSKTSGGGDYDVVACADGLLLYVETKSAAPRNIEATQMAAFVKRVATLAPDMAVLINDTQLRMLDKLVPAVQQAARHELPGLGRMRRLRGEIFAARDCLFVTNSEPDLAGNLGICISHFLRSRSALGRPLF